jgi:hypothetical protein
MHALNVGDLVRISFPGSKYCGVVGSVWDLSETSDYVVVDMPKGTELRLERIANNSILAELARRKNPHPRPPEGDPQWFPERWLELTQERPDLDDNGQPVIRGYNASRRLDRSVHEAIGLVRGVIADGVITPAEVELIAAWLIQNQEAAAIWPVNVVLNRVSEIMLDGKVDAEERADFLVLLRDLVGAGAEVGVVDSAPTRLPLTQPPPPVQFGGRTFVFTGRFLYGTRRACWRAVAELGGSYEDAVTQRTDYLVIGSAGSADWVHSSHGRKIEKAVWAIEQGHRLLIISEEHWVKHIDPGLARIGAPPSL